MYKHYFGLRDHPFRLVPDPHYFFPASFHKVINKCLLEGLIGTLPMAVVSGPAGVGKTLLLTRLMTQLGKSYPVILIANPKLHFEELLSFIQSGFNIKTDEQASTAARFSALEIFGQHSSQAGKRPVILIDEADGISEETLRALSKLASPAATGIPSFFIVLAIRNDTSKYVGLLSESPGKMKAYSLMPLLADQIGPYVDLRLRQAGYTGDPILNPAAITRLTELSQGIPRLINRLCDAALLEASLRHERSISLQIINEVAQGMWLALGHHTPPSNPPLAKGMEAAFSPEIEPIPIYPTPPLPIQSDTIALSETMEEESPLDEDHKKYAQSSLPKEEFQISKGLYAGNKGRPSLTEQVPEFTSAAQNGKGSTTLLKRLHINGKKPQIALAMGIVATLMTGSLYVWVLAPNKISLSSAAGFTKALKKDPEPRENTDQPSQNPQTIPTEQAQNPVIAVDKPKADSNKISSNLQIAALSAQMGQQQEQDTDTLIKPEEENTSRISPPQGIAALLARAKQQIADLKLTTPEGDNAYKSFMKILKRVPNHPEAIKGLQRIRNYYVSWGLKAESQQQLSLAATYYRRALTIFPDDSALRTALHRVQAQRKSR